MIKQFNKGPYTESREPPRSQPCRPRRHHSLSIRTAHGVASDDNAGSMENPVCEWLNTHPLYLNCRGYEYGGYISYPPNCFSHCVGLRWWFVLISRSTIAVVRPCDYENLNLSTFHIEDYVCTHVCFLSGGIAFKLFGDHSATRGNVFTNQILQRPVERANAPSTVGRSLY